MAARTFVNAPLINTPGTNVRRGPYYSISAIWMSVKEFQLIDSSIVGLSDFHREGGNTLQYIHTLLSTINVAIPHNESSASLDCYFVHVPDVGYCLLICCKSFEYFSKWSIGLQQIFNQTSTQFQRKLKTLKLSPAISVGNLVAQINATFHPSFTSAFLDSSRYMSFGDIGSAHEQLQMHHRLASSQQQAGQAPANADEQAAASHSTIIAAMVHTLVPTSFLNPLLAMSCHRVLVSHHLYSLTGDDSLSFLASDLDGGIFDVDEPGVVDFHRVPAGVRVFTVSLETMSPANLFPGVLPPPVQLVQLFTQCGAPNIAKAVVSMSPHNLTDAVLTCAPLDPDDPDGPRFFNPVARLCMVHESSARSETQMPYLLSAAENLAAMRSDDSVTAADYKAAFVHHVTTCIGQMAKGDNTPKSIRGAATIVLTGLSVSGLHPVRVEDRLSQTGGWISFSIRTADKMGVSRQHTAVVLRWMVSTLTTFVSAHGGFHIALSGEPSDGKTYTIDTLMRAIAPYMTSILTASQHAFTSYDAKTENRSILFIDEASSTSIPPDILKMIAGRETTSGRMRNVDYDKSKPGDSKAASGCIPTMGIIMATNLKKDALFVAPATSGASKYGRPRSEYGNGGGGASGDSRAPNSDALHSRFGFYELRRATIPIAEMMGRVDESGTASNLAAIAAPLAFMYNVAVLVATLIRDGVITQPISLDKASIITQLHKHFMQQHTNLPKIDNRIPVRFSATALVCAILEQVYERVMQGGDHIPSASVEMLADIIFDISISVIPTKENVLFGAGMVYEAVLDEFSGKDALPKALLYAISAHRGLMLDFATYDIPVAEADAIAKKVGMSGDVFRERMQRLCSETLCIEDAERVGDSIAYKKHTAPVVVVDSSTWLINRAYLRAGISVNDVFDSCVLDEATRGARFEAFMTVLEELPVRAVAFIDGLLERIIRHPLSGGSSHLECATLLAEQLEHRLYMGLIVPSGGGSANVIRPWWKDLTPTKIAHRMYADSASPAAVESMVFTLSLTYLTLLQVSEAGESVIVRAFRTVVTEPSEIPILVPSANDVRLPEVVVVKPGETAPHWKFQYVPTNGPDRTPLVFDFAKNPDQIPPHEYALLLRMGRDYHIAANDSDQIDELQRYYDIRSFTAAMNVDQANLPPTISEFRLDSTPVTSVVSSRRSQIRHYLSVLKRLAPEDADSSDESHPPEHADARPSRPAQSRSRASVARMSPKQSKQMKKKRHSKPSRQGDAGAQAALLDGNGAASRQARRRRRLEYAPGCEDAES